MRKEKINKVRAAIEWQPEERKPDTIGMDEIRQVLERLEVMD